MIKINIAYYIIQTKLNLWKPRTTVKTCPGDHFGQGVRARWPYRVKRWDDTNSDQYGVVCWVVSCTPTPVILVILDSGYQHKEKIPAEHRGKLRFWEMKCCVLGSTTETGRMQIWAIVFLTPKPRALRRHKVQHRVNEYLLSTNFVREEEKLADKFLPLWSFPFIEEKRVCVWKRWSPHSHFAHGETKVYLFKRLICCQDKPSK